MAPEELADILSRMYREAPVGEATTMIHLFGIRYAGEIRTCGASASKIVHLSGLSDSYDREVFKGMRHAMSCPLAS